MRYGNWRLTRDDNWVLTKDDKWRRGLINNFPIKTS